MPVIIRLPSSVQSKLAPGPVPAHGPNHAMFYNNGKIPSPHTIKGDPNLVIDRLVLCFGASGADHGATVFENLRSFCPEGISLEQASHWGKGKPLAEKLWTKGYGTYGPVRKGIFPLAAYAHLPGGNPDGDWAKPAKVPGVKKKHQPKPLFACLGLSLRPKQPFGRLDINPSRWSPEQLDNLFGRLEETLQLGPYGGPSLGKVLSKATCSWIDLAIDVRGIKPADYVWIDETPKGKKMGETVHYIKHHQVQTIYAGKFPTKQSKASANWCIYDKTAEAGLPEQVTRIERHMPRPQRKASLLHTVENPFLYLRCYDPRIACELAGIPEGDLRNSIVLNLTRIGVPPTLASLSPDFRVRLETALPQAVPAWWRPADTWKQLPAALARALPAALQ